MVVHASCRSAPGASLAGSAARGPLAGQNVRGARCSCAHDELSGWPRLGHLLARRMLFRRGMKTRSALMGSALSGVMACGLLACDQVPELVPTSAPVEEAWLAWSDSPVGGACGEGDGTYTVHTADGISATVPVDLGCPAEAIRVDGGAWVCGSRGVAVYEQATGTWTTSTWDASPFEDDWPPDCALFDARGVRDGWIWTTPMLWDGHSSRLCRGGPEGWECEETSVPQAAELVVTETKVWLLMDYWYEPGDRLSVAAVDAAGTEVFDLDAAPVSFTFERIPRSDAVVVVVEPTIFQLDGTSVKRIDDLPAGIVVPRALDRHYILASEVSKDVDCDVSWTHSNCETTEVHWSQVTVFDFDTDHTDAVGRHRESGVEWYARGRLDEDGELRVNAGGTWYRLP